MGQYAFVESYCEDPDCDCRRVILRVIQQEQPEKTLATINYGWDSTEFYTQWMHGDKKAARDIKGAWLDPLNEQSEYAGEFLKLFRSSFITDPGYVARLAHHYVLFKKDLELHPNPTPEPPPVPKTADEIVARLRFLPMGSAFAPYRDALLAARAHREELVPRLIAAIELVTNDPHTYMKTADQTLHLFAICLLGEFRETRALDCFMKFFRLPGDLALDLTGDIVTEQGGAVLASVCGGNSASLLQLIQDESVNDFVQAAAFQGLAAQHLWGERSRDALVADLRQLFQSLPRPGNSYRWYSLVGLICDFNLVELVEEARQAFAAGLVDEMEMNLEYFEEKLESDIEERLSDFKERNSLFNAIDLCFGWICFSEEQDDFAPDPWLDDMEPLPKTFVPDYPTEPYVAPEPYVPPQPYIAPEKVGRNDPCPCGSGRKFKKCCGQ